MRFITLSLILSFILISGYSQDKKAYQIFTSDGVAVNYFEMLDDMYDGDIIFFGEHHNNPIIHWLQLELTKDLYKQKTDNLIISAEMFESDNQVIVDEYMEGLISQSRFEAECRLWPNYETDYKPLLEFAKTHQLTFVASNIPRRYANAVSKGGFEALESFSKEAKSFLPPMPIAYDSTLNGYRSMMEMEGMGGHVTSNFPKAQAIKDATMAYNIDRYFKNGNQLIHYVGSGHINNFEGIVWYMYRYSPAYRIKVISVVEQGDISKLEEESLGLADFIIAVPENMTKTY